MGQREQDSISTAFLKSLMREHLAEEGEMEVGVRMDVRPAPSIQGDETLSNLAGRIVDEVVTTPTNKSLASQVLSQAGILPEDGPGEPEVANGHLRHVSKRAKKIAIKENKERRVRRVVKTRAVPSQSRPSRGPPSSSPRRGPPQATRSRPSIGMEDETRNSARNPQNKRGKRQRKMRT